ncbi:MAG TPA: hypothetical protein QGF05_02340 [Dehalococcoidia bacterium]|nr:hypothetical protein [Dehalococcoidia bacterium]
MLADQNIVTEFNAMQGKTTMLANLKLLEVEVSEGVRAITIHHKHPACILTLDLARELATAIDEAEADDATRVMVFRSADPDFFIAHFDVSEIVKWAEGDFSSNDHPFSDARVQSVRDGGSRQQVRPSSSERLRVS